MKIVFLFLFLCSFLFANDSNKSNNNVTLKEEVWKFEAIEPFEIKKKMKVAILISKKRYFKYIPTLMNSLNAYLVKKDIPYSLNLVDFDKDKNLSRKLDTITKNYPYIFFYTKNRDNLVNLKNYPYNYFFIPTINKSDTNISAENIFFGGIDYEQQIMKLSSYVKGFTIIFNSNNLELSKILAKKEAEILTYPYKILSVNKSNFKKSMIKNSYIFLNSDSVTSSQILSSLFFYNNLPKMILSTQINYNPLIFTLTQKESRKNILISSSIYDFNPIINDNNLLLNSNIKYNWLNYSSSILMNKVYNLEEGYNEFYANDFYLYMFHNQINYKINLFKVERNGFKKIKQKESLR